MIECCWMLLQQLNPIYRDATTTYKNPTFSAAHWRHVTSRPMTIHLPSRSLLGPSYWCCSRDAPMRQSIQCTWFWGHGCWKVGDWAATERAKSHCRLFEFINNNKIIINLYSAVKSEDTEARVASGQDCLNRWVLRFLRCRCPQYGRI